MKIIKKIWKWVIKNRLRKILSATLAILILLTSIKFIFLNPKEAKAAISEVNTSSSTTLDQTTYTQVNSMTLTPGAGDYLAIFTMEVQYSASPSSNAIFVSLFVNGTQQTHTERKLNSDGSLTSSIQTVTTHSYVTLSAGQAVDVRYKISATPAMTGLSRNLTLLPVNSANVTQVTATADDTTSSASYTQVNSMTVTPGGGDYLLVFSTSEGGTNAAGGEIANFAVFVNGVVLQHSERTFEQEPSIPTREYPILIAVKVSPGPGEAVTIQWKNSGAGTSLTAHQRTLTLVKMGANELYEANATADATATNTADVRIDSMVLAPKAADYLAIFSGSDHYGTVSTGADETASYSFYTGGYQISATERDFMREESIDNVDMYDFTVGKITVKSGENAEVMWRGVQTGTRTIHERTFILVREPVTNSATGPVYLGLNEGSDRFVNDSNIDIAPGELRNGVWKTKEYCKTGRCVYFDGTGDYILLNDDADLDMGTGETVTIEGWFRSPDTTSGTRTIISKEEPTGTDGGYKVTMNSSGQIVFGIDNDNTSFPSDSVTSTSAYDDNQWHHFAAVKDGGTSITLYIDGNSVGTPDSSIQNNVSNDDPLFIGIDNFSSNGWSGYIDEVKVYRSARSASEIKTDYTGETPSRGSSASFGPDNSYLTNGLVGYWPMDETGNSCSGGTNDNCDQSGNNKDGAWNGNTTYTTGKFGNGTTYDGTGDYTAISESDSDGNLDFSTGDNFTLSFWLNPTSLPSGSTYDTYVGKNNGSDGWYAQIQGTGNMEFCITNTSSQCYTSTSTPITTGVWQHYVISMTFGSDETTKMFYNGNQVPGSWASGTNLAPPLSNDALRIGGNGDGTEEATGKVDEVRLYNRVLSPSEVQQLDAWAPGPIGYWRMDENLGTLKSLDSSGYSNDMTMNGGINKWSNCKFGSCLEFDGTDDQLMTSNTSTYDMLPQLSVSAWVYSNTGTYSTTARIVTKNPSAAAGWMLGWGQTSNRVYFSVGYDTTSMVVRAFSMNPNTWNYVTATWDGTSNATGVKLYLNGVEASTYAEQTNGSTTRSDDSANEVSIGVGANGSQGPFNGKIDDVKIYNYIRSASQIVEDMNGGHPAPGSPVGSAIGFWKFDEGVDNSCSGGSNDACNSGTSGTTLDGTESGMAVPATSTSGWTNNGKFGKALSFDGTNDYVQVTDSSDLDITGDFTLSAWVARAGGTNGYIISKTNASTDGGYALLHGNSGEVYCRTSNGSGYVDSYTATGYVNSDSVWHHLVAVRSGTSCHVWIDGKDRTNTYATHSTMTANSNNLRFGARPDGASDWFNGKIDSVQIFNTALSSSQIIALYNQGSQTSLGTTSTDTSGNASSSAQREYCPPGNTEGNCGSGDPSPIGEWKMDDDNGTTTAVDTSGNGNNGTISNPADTIWVPGVHGSAVNFDITANTKMDMGNPTVFNNLSALTADIWVYPKSAGDNSEGRFFDKTASTGPNTGWYFKFTGSSRTMQFKVDCGTAGGDVNDLTLESVEALPLNSWSHIALTWDGNANPTGHARMYINGRETTYTGATSCVGGRVTETASNLKIGNQQGSNQRTFDGYMEEARLYNYVRTPAQVAWDYNKGKPVAWYKFDECTGSTAYNSAPYGNSIAAGMDATIVIGGTGTQTSTGTCSTVNTATSWYNGRTGKYNSGLSTDATNDYAYVADTTAIDFTSDMTVSGWVNTATLPSSAAKNIEIVNKYLTSTNQRAYRLFVDSADNKYYFYTDGDGATGGTMICASTSTITTGTWHFVAGTFTGSGGTIYVDGRQEGTCSAGFSTIFNGNEDLVIGMDANKTSAPDAAIYDDIRLYNYALSAKQIQLLYNEGAAVRFGP